MSLLSRPIIRRGLLIGAVVAAAGGGAYFAQPWITSGEAAAPTATPSAPVEVGVQTIHPRTIRAWSEFSGRLHPVQAVDIRPEVGGRITDVRIEDGEAVQAGDVLFVIDPDPYEATVARAEAALGSAKANLTFATTDFERAAALVQKRIVARRFYDERQNAERVAKAALRTAEAELRQARIDLDHAYIKAPISGRVGRVEITLGNLVQPGAAAPLLTTLVSNAEVYADFEVDEQTYLRSIRDHATGNAAERLIPVQLSLQDRQATYRGYIHAFDNRIDVGSGTIRARAKFENADGRLLPGMFVAVRLADAAEQEALIVPERAIGTDQGKKFLYVVGSSDRVAYREVRLGRQVPDAGRIVLAGVEAGDRVVVEGLQHVRPDTPVATSEIAPQFASEQFAASPAAVRVSGTID